MPLRLPNRATAKEVPEVYTLWQKNPSPENTAALLQYLRPTIDKALQAFAGGDPALRMQAKILAKQVAATYDPSRGASLSSHVYGNLQRLNRLRQQRNSPVKVPESVRNTQVAVIRFRENWKEQHDREPTEDELRSHLGLSTKQLAKAFGARADMPESSLVSERGDAWLTPSTDPEIHARRLFMDYIYHDQDPVGKQLMELVMGYGGRQPISKTQAATKLKISSPAVSQRLDGIMKKLDDTPTYARPDTDFEYDTDAAE